MTMPLHKSIQHLNADLPIKPETVELINKLAEAAYKTDMKKEQHPTLPSDEEGLKAIRTGIISKHLQRIDKDNGTDTFFAYHEAMEEYASARIPEINRLMEISIEIERLLTDGVDLISGESPLYINASDYYSQTFETP